MTTRVRFTSAASTLVCQLTYTRPPTYKMLWSSTAHLLKRPLVDLLAAVASRAFTVAALLFGTRCL